MKKKEKENITSAKDPQLQMIPISYFFRFLSVKERIMMYIGNLSAVIAGVLMPSIAILMGEIINDFNPNNPKTLLLNKLSTLAIWISVIGIIGWIFTYIFFAFWQHLAENISFDLRRRFLDKLLTQEIAYFET